MYTTLPGFDGDITFEQAEQIIHWYQHVSTDDVDEAISLLESSDEDGNLTEEEELYLQSTLLDARRYVEQYSKAQARIEREMSERAAVMAKIKEACALTGVKTPDLKPNHALIVLIRVQTTISNVWAELSDDDPADKADQLVSEVRDILLEAAEEFCDA